MKSPMDNLLNCPSVLTGMSHEMRTNMNAIVAFSYLMKEPGCQDSERDDFSTHILNACEKIISLFDTFLDSAIIDTGNIDSTPGVCRLNNFLDDLFSEFREELKKEPGKDLALIIDSQVSNSVEAIIDRNKISRVIRSLFLNSLKNTRSGYIKIGYFLRDENVNFYVIDSGQGYFRNRDFMHSADLNESLLLHKDTYSAVNISLAKKIIKMLGGTVSIDCNGLTGTGIYFSVPAKLAANTNMNINQFVNTMIAI